MLGSKERLPLDSTLVIFGKSLANSSGLTLDRMDSPANGNDSSHPTSIGHRHTTRCWIKTLAKPVAAAAPKASQSGPQVATLGDGDFRLSKTSGRLLVDVGRGAKANFLQLSGDFPLNRTKPQ